ncbi:hypothetical protein F4861DRAFT_18166 [Xylaria intraflava]|nr:hypothetical protein F4861DRAFT_18166 [Xylaria intraflava]
MPYRYCSSEYYSESSDGARYRRPSPDSSSYCYPNPFRPISETPWTWTELYRQQRNILWDENYTLKEDLAASHEENDYLHSRVHNLQARIDARGRHLDFPALSCRKITAPAEEFRDKSRALAQQKKKSDLTDVRVRALSRAVRDQNDEIARLQRDGKRNRRDIRALGRRLDDSGWEVSVSLYR